MDEYISREATIKRIKEVYCVGCNSYHGVRCRACGTGDAIDIIDDFPAADVAPVVHGRWDDEHKCTVCHNEAFYKISNIRPDYDYDWEENLVETGDYIWDIEWTETAYCPNCGSKMDR